MSQHTPVRARRGRVTHATSLSVATQTVCGREFSGWIISLHKVDCLDCTAALVYPVKPRAPR